MPFRLGRPLISRPLDCAILLCLAGAAAWSALAMPRLRFVPDMGASITGDAELREYREATALFPDEHLVIISLPCADPYADASMDRLKSLSAALGVFERNGIWKLYSPTTVSDISRRGDEMVSTPLCEQSSNGAELRSRLGSSPLLSRLFLPSGGRAWTLLLSLTDEKAPLLAYLGPIREAFPEARIAGSSYYQAINERILTSQSLRLLEGSAAVLLAVELIIMRSLWPALLLWLFSCLPALLLMGLFVLTGTPIQLHYVLAPVLTLSLSNSYVTHIYRGWAECGFDARAALRSRAGISLLDAFTTVLGFSSLFFSPIRELVVLGALSIAGACLSILSGLVGLPAALGFAGRPSSAARRFASEEGKKARDPGFRWLRIGAWAAFCLLLGFSSSRIESGFSARDFFMPWSEAGKETAYFERNYEGLGEVSLIVRTGKANGLVDIGFFRSLDSLQKDLAALPGVGSVYGPTDLVKEALARWEGGAASSVDPLNEADIGESLELLSGSAGGLFSRGFVDPSWSSAKIRISVSPNFREARDVPILEARAAKLIAARVPGATCLWAGDLVFLSINERAFNKGQISGSFGFFALLFVGLCLVFRSVPQAFAVSIVPLTGFLASLGLMGLLGWRLSAVHAVALATIAGTGVDNAIVLVLRGWSREARNAIIDTTLLIVISMASLLFCSSYLVFQTTIICMIGLVASSFSAALVLPAIRNEASRR